MKYYIEFDYTTGDSFHSEDREGIALNEFEWENLEIVKENLQRIVEHYNWLKNLNSWSKKIREGAKEPSWRKVKQLDRFEPSEEIINLKLDNGEEVQFWPDWCGYFETLHAVRIKTKNSEEDMEIII